MEDFFEQEPRVVGVILELKQKHGSMFILPKIKNSLMEFAKTLKFSTEDKVYVYSPAFTEMRKWMGECVADIANYSQCKIDPRLAIETTIDVLIGQPYNKTILYITDHSDTLTESAIMRGLRRDRWKECSFRFLDFSVLPISPQLYEEMTNGSDHV
jgi:hypothetical protein